MRAVKKKIITINNGRWLPQIHENFLKAVIDGC